MGKLEDMRVERVDGVDRPATGHRWVIVKNEQGEVEKDYAGAARTALEALAKEDSVAVSPETAEALTKLAALLDMSVEFKSVQGAPAASDDTDDEPAATAADDEPLTKSTLKAALMEVFASEDGDEDDDEDDDDEVEKATPKSQQPQEQDDTGQGSPLTRGRVRKSGRPSYANVIFDQ